MEFIIYLSQTTATQPTSVAKNKTTRHELLKITPLEILMRVA